MNRKPALPLLAAIALSGCAMNQQIPKPADTPGWQVHTVITPQQPRQLDPVTFNIHVTDKADKPLTGAAITVNCYMPGMDMGDMRVVMQQSGPSSYLAVERFTMPGKWKLAVTVKRGTETATQIVPVTVTQ